MIYRWGKNKWRPVIKIKYVNNTVILSENIENLQRLLNKISQIGIKSSLNINIAKTKLWFLATSLHFDNKQIES